MEKITEIKGQPVRNQAGVTGHQGTDSWGNRVRKRKAKAKAARKARKRNRR